MRRLILMRHAKAEKGSPTGEDFDRPLNARGKRDAALIGEALARADLIPDVALVSSAARTRETWAAAQASFPNAVARFSRTLYLADPQEILDEIEAETTDGVVMVVAHNPGVHALAMHLLSQASAPPNVMDRFDRGFPTATAAAFEIDEAGRAHYDGLFLAAEHGGGGGE